MHTTNTCFYKFLVSKSQSTRATEDVVHVLERMWSLVTGLQSADESHHHRMYLTHVKLSGSVNMEGVWKGEFFIQNDTETVATVETKLSHVNDYTNNSVCVFAHTIHITHILTVCIDVCPSVFLCITPTHRSLNVKDQHVFVNLQWRRTAVSWGRTSF